MHKRFQAFTIVELLIVIVVIGILAAISIVSYNGVSNHANDAAVMSDLGNMGKQIQMHLIEVDHTPLASPSALAGAGVSPTKSAYDTSSHAGLGQYNLVYCRDSSSSGYALVAWSKSGNGFVYEGGQVDEFGYSPAVQATTCSRVDSSASYNSYTWIYHSGTWRI